jgi:hypothetical protein
MQITPLQLSYLSVKFLPFSKNIFTFLMMSSGVDIGGRVGTPVTAFADGVISSFGYNPAAQVITLLTLLTLLTDTTYITDTNDTTDTTDTTDIT